MDELSLQYDIVIAMLKSIAYKMDNTKEKWTDKYEESLNLAEFATEAAETAKKAWVLRYDK